jgi:hypothetical protein
MTGLDPGATRNVDETLLATCAQFKVAPVVIAHDMLAGGGA